MAIDFKTPGQVSGRAQNDNVKMGDLADEGALVGITYRGFKEEIQTSNGVADAAEVDLEIVTGAHAGKVETDRLVFNKGITNALEGAEEGDLVVGRLEYRKTKTGRDAICLVDPSESDVETLRAYFDAK